MTARLRTLVVCPGRGSYDRNSLGSLGNRSEAVATFLERCDAYRGAQGQPTVSELDQEPAYRSSLHVAGEHASLLTFAASYADWLELDRDHYEVVAIAGNSMGWYTSLAVSGALPLDDAIRLVDTLGRYQHKNVIGGQVLYPVCSPDWSPSAERLAHVEEALAAAAAAGHVAEWSIDLGGFAVLGADRPGVKFLLQQLPSETRGSRAFPLQLPLHSAFHTSLMEATSHRAVAELADLRFSAPQLPLIDGRGMVFRPRSANPRAIRDYTLGHQIVRPYAFTLSIQTALHFSGADVVVCLGPGNPLGGPVARILVQDGWRGLRNRAAFLESDEPVLRSFGLPDQRARLIAT